MSLVSCWFVRGTDELPGDEQKPRCANCEVKGFACKYGNDLAFVPGRAGAVPGGIGQVYGKITVS